jgi:hypothetical protein
MRLEVQIERADMRGDSTRSNYATSRVHGQAESAISCTTAVETKLESNHHRLGLIVASNMMLNQMLHLLGCARSRESAFLSLERPNGRPAG